MKVVKIAAAPTRNMSATLLFETSVCTIIRTLSVEPMCVV